MMPSVSGVRARATTTRSAPGSESRQQIALEHHVGAVHVLGPVAHDGDVAVERLEQPQQRLGDAAAAEDGDAGAEQVGALRLLPRRSARA